MRIFSIITALSLFSTASHAATIDLNDFFADPEVTVAADGSIASFVESSFVSTVFLSNDPGLGDPNVIVPVDGAILSFDYSFTEGANNSDGFYAFVIDGTTGASIGSSFEFETFDSSSGSVSFNLTPLVGQTLGFQFEMFAQPGDTGLDSTLTIANVSIDVNPIPLPAGAPLALTGLAGMAYLRRRQVRDSKTG